MANLYEDMIEYVAETSALLDAAKNRKDGPRFGKEALDKTVDTLVKTRLIKSAERESAIKLFAENPDKVLESLEKVASLVGTSPADNSLGGPVRATKTAAPSARASDEALLRGLGIR